MSLDDRLELRRVWFDDEKPTIPSLHDPITMQHLLHPEQGWEEAGDERSNFAASVRVVFAELAGVVRSYGAFKDTVTEFLPVTPTKLESGHRGLTNEM